MQLNLSEGERRRDKGMKKVSAANHDFIESMRDVARMLIREKTWITTDDLRVWAEEHGVEPSHHNAWGSIFRHGDFESVGFRKSEQPQRHAAMVRVWTLAEPMKLEPVYVKKESKK